MNANEQLECLRHSPNNSNNWKEKVSFWHDESMAVIGATGLSVKDTLSFYTKNGNHDICELYYGYSNANKMHFFPYFSGTTLPGFCIVPVACNFGTLVSTGGMNGCTLHIYRTTRHYIFIHDNNHQLVNSDDFAIIVAEDYELDGIQHKVISLTESWYWPKDYKSERKFRTFIPMISIRRSELACHFSAFKFEPAKGMKDPIPVRNENRLFYIDSTTGTVNNMF